LNNNFEKMNGFGVLVFTPVDLQWPPHFHELDLQWKVTRHGA
jgi:hypothetical protein